MHATLNQPKVRGIYCRHCGKPLRLPDSILKRESFLKDSESSSDDHWCSRVFSHRCRICCGESIYALNHIVDFEEENPVPDKCH
jgi:hypothetical protein